MAGPPRWCWTGFCEKCGRSLKDWREAFCVSGGFVLSLISTSHRFTRRFLLSLRYVFPYVFVVAVRERKAVYACKMGAKKGFGWGDTGDFGDRARAIAGLWIATRMRRLRERLISCWRPPLTKFFGASTHVFQTESALCRVTTTVQQLSTGQCADQNVNCLTCISTVHSQSMSPFRADNQTIGFTILAT